MTGRSAPFQAAFLCVFVFLGCKSPGSKAQPSAAASASGAQVIASATTAKPVLPQRRYLPEGPRLGMFAGEGVGAIRFGATVATIERLMEGPCEVKTADSCRYIVRAVDFHLKDGAVDRIVVSSHKRSAGLDANGQPQLYGFFNGVIPPDLYFGMVPKAIRDVLGPPISSEPVTTKNEFDTVQRDTYPGMVVEYDRYSNGNLILGGVILTKK